MKLPIFFEDSKIPVVLSFISPITINAITLGPLIFARGKLAEVTRNHESIHWAQYKETLLIGFLLIYAFYWLLGVIKFKSGSQAYYKIPFEQEAYANENNFDYLRNRRLFSWVSYLRL